MTKKMQKLTAQNNSFVALITPFKKGKVDFKALEKLIEFQIENGIDGIVPCGTTGESPTLSHQEHNEIIEFALSSLFSRNSNSIWDSFFRSKIS